MTIPIPKDAADSTSGAGHEIMRGDTALQSHVIFFDRDRDGIIWPSDTYVGFRRLGFGILISLLAVIVIHPCLSYATYGSWLPDPFFRLSVEHMHRGKHGSDTANYTSRGVFDERRFDNNFDMYSADPHTHINFWQGVRMLYGNRDVFDPFGWTAALLEWGATYLMIWPADGKLAKEDVKAVYDGSIFYTIASRREARAKGSKG